MRNPHNKSKFLLNIISASVLSGLFGASAVFAADEAQADEKSIEVINVTSTRRVTSIQETAISMEAYSGQELAEKGYTNIGQFIDTVPGVTAAATGPGQNKVIIRNIATSTQEGGAPVVASYFNDFALPGGGAADIRLVDMERVEVLKGPQGTLYGKSAMGGIVRYISNKANTDQMEGGINVYSSSTTDGGTNYGGHGYFNLPLTDTLAVRFVGYSYQNEGFLDNVELGLDDVNDESTTGGRVAVHWQPTEEFTADLTYFNQSVDGAPNWVTTTRDPGDLNIVGDEGPDIPFDIEGRSYVAGVVMEAGKDIEIANIKLNYDFDGFSAAFIGTTSETKTSFVFDQREYVGLRAGCLCDEQVSGNKQPVATNDVAEFRLVSNNDSAFDWILGAYYEKGDSLDYQNITYKGPDQPMYIPVPFPPYLLVFPLTEGMNMSSIENLQNNEEKAVYAELGYAISDNTHFTVGARHSQIEFDSTAIEAGGLLGLINGSGALVGITFGTKEKVNTYKFALEHKINDDMFAYATASSGYRRGGFNLPSVTAPFSTYDSDTLWNYEAGLKATMLDGDLVASASIYYIDWNDIQLVVQDPVTFLRATENAGKAKVTGIELSLAYQINDNFDVAVTGAISNPELLEDVPGGVSGKKGDRLPGSAKSNFSVSANWFQELSGGWDMFANGTYKYTGERLNDFNTDLDISLDSYSLTDLRFGVRNDDAGYSIALYADNVFDEAVTFLVDHQGPLGFDSAPTNRPRTVGVNLTYNF